jgi:hypothetical protein
MIANTIKQSTYGTLRTWFVLIIKTILNLSHFRHLIVTLKHIMIKNGEYGREIIVLPKLKEDYDCTTYEHTHTNISREE